MVLFKSSRSPLPVGSSPSRRAAKGRVIGPLVGEVLGACDARLEGEEPGLVIYVVEVGPSGS